MQKRHKHMKTGYVYILINQSMPGLLKIGKTTRNSRDRARELSTSGVPTPFQVAFEIFSEDHEKLEHDIHRQLNDFRVATNREFFKYPIDKAICLLQELSAPPVDNNSVYIAEDILQRLRENHSDDLKSNIVAVRIVQTKDRVWLEITTENETAGYLRDQTIQRTDLGFIVDIDDDINYFSPDSSVSDNALRFVDDFGDYSMMMTTDLFHEEACHRINEYHNSTRKTR